MALFRVTVTTTLLGLVRAQLRIPEFRCLRVLVTSTCVDGDDDLLILRSFGDLWTTTAGTDYYIYVYGWAAAGFHSTLN